MVTHLVIPCKAWDHVVMTATFLILWRVCVVETTGPGEEVQHMARFAGLAVAPYSTSLAAPA